jgi:hypothetical protein
MFNGDLISKFVPSANIHTTKYRGLLFVLNMLYVFYTKKNSNTKRSRCVLNHFDLYANILYTLYGVCIPPELSVPPVQNPLRSVAAQSQYLCITNT